MQNLPGTNLKRPREFQPRPFFMGNQQFGIPINSAFRVNCSPQFPEHPIKPGAGISMNKKSLLASQSLFSSLT